VARKQDFLISTYFKKTKQQEDNLSELCFFTLKKTKQQKSKISELCFCKAKTKDI